MLNFLIKKFKDEKGAVDKILVALLLIIFALSAIVIYNTWIMDESEKLQKKAFSESVISKKHT
ncbi:hypothetical protein [Arcobacter sp. YIC-80]|uniref:hypothetical protein n=1 Tax=unclassified Arcobacter TaxID=2593671 RepID=UPI00384C33F9